MMNSHTDFKLDFVCVGPQRTASSWLDLRLRANPAIALPERVKETFFLDRHFDRGWNWYSAHFAEGSGSPRVHGEIAPTCFDNTEARERLAAHNPRTKIIVCLRDPVARAYSLYCLHYAKGRLRCTFAEALHSVPGIISSGRYAEHLLRWVDVFGADRVLLVPHKSVISAPEELLNEVCSFLDCPSVAWGVVNEVYGEAAQPRSFALAKAAASVARALREFGAHRLVEAGKSVGIKQLFFQGGEPRYPPMTDEDRALLERVHADDIALLNGMVFAGACATWTIATQGDIGRGEVHGY